jgi:hypothetical protein
MSATEVEIATLPYVSPGGSRPYAPSWLNRLLAWIGRLPGPTWWFYAAFAVVTATLGQVIFWRAGTLPVGEIDPAQIFWGVYLPAQLWTIGYLDGVAREALSAFRPAYEMDDGEAGRLEYQLTVVPAVPAAIIGLAVLPVTLLGYVVDPVAAGVAGYDAVTLTARAASEWFVGAVLLVFVYHTLRQLRLVSRLHDQVARIDLFQPRPLYSFSRLTSRTGMALLLFVATGLAASPGFLASDAFWTLWAPWLIGVPLVAVAVFVLPLYGMHLRLAAAKDTMQGQADARIKMIVDELNAAADARDLGRADGLQKLLAGQLSQREVCARLSTWPWSGGTLRGFLSALLLPIAVFLIQRALVALLPS